MGDIRRGGPVHISVALAEVFGYDAFMDIQENLLEELRRLAGAGPSLVQRTQLQESQAANAILQQLGGAGRLKAMIGAKHFMGGKNSLSFKFPNRSRSKPNYVTITLESSDTYTVEFHRVSLKSAANTKLTSKHEHVYVEDLRPLFEEKTGLRLSL